MNSSRKTILIKVTSSIGSSMSSNAEYHTLYYFCKWLTKENDIVVSGIEIDSPLIKKLEKFNVKVKKPFLKYFFLKNLKYFFHIPISIVNTFIDAILIKPDLLICLGGVFYNGLGILLAGKILGVKTLVRSAEDHIGIIQFESKFGFHGFYARLRAFISKLVIKNSDYFLTVGEWSIKYFREKYKLSPSRSFMIPGPIDSSICQRKSFLKTKEESKKYLINRYLLPDKQKTILFIGSRVYKGIENVFELLEKIIKLNISTNVLWISNSSDIQKRVNASKLNRVTKIIKPVDREEIVNLIKGSDFLFWSTPLGVGYGQILLESILCDTEILCYQPVGDAKYLVKEKFYSNMNEVLNRITNKTIPKKIKIPEYMKEEILSNNYLDIFNYILDN